MMFTENLDATLNRPQRSCLRDLPNKQTITHEFLYDRAIDRFDQDQLFEIIFGLPMTKTRSLSKRSAGLSAFRLPLLCLETWTRFNIRSFISLKCAFLVARLMLQCFGFW